MADERVALDIEMLVAEHHGAVYRCAYRLTGSIPDAEDLTQQVFLAAQRRLAQLRNPDCARGWLLAILPMVSLRTIGGRCRCRPQPSAWTSTPCRWKPGWTVLPTTTVCKRPWRRFRRIFALCW